MSAPTCSRNDPTAHDEFHPPRPDHSPSRDPIGFHVTLRLADDRPIATTTAALRILARVVLAQGESRGLLAFGAADNHLHAELANDRVSAGAFANYVETALRWQLRLGARFEPARIRPLHDQRHAYNTFHYTHRQDSRHELDLDRAREGTSLPDLLGLRVLKTSLIVRVRAHLPRVHRKDLVGHFPPGIFDRSSSNERAPIELDVLAEAAAAALALPNLDGRSVDAWRARRAAIQAAGPGVPVRVLSECLGVGVRAIHSLRACTVEPDLIRAVEKQATLRTAMRRLPKASTILGG